MFYAAERLMGMDDAVWRRHANVWSVWTRIPIGPLLVLAIYARAWIGWWCLLPIALLLLWNWLNPRVFPAPKRLDSWAARGVMGERLFLARKQRPIPRHHLVAAWTTTAIALAGLPITDFGLWVLNPWATALGAVFMFLGKLWFVDHMVWL